MPERCSSLCVERVQKSDEVLICNQRGQEISVASFRETSNMPNYGLLTGLPAEIPWAAVK